jgi:hypothetical protein
MEARTARDPPLTRYETDETDERAGMAAAPLRRTDVDWVVSVARTVDDVERIRNVWSELQGDAITADPEMFLDGLTEDPSARPHIVLLERGDDLQVLLIAYVRDLKLAYKFGYKWLHTPFVRAISVVYRGALGPVDEDVAGTLLAELRAAVERHEADAIHFTRLTPDSALYRSATNGRTFPRILVRRPMARWELALPPSFEDFVRSRPSATRRIRNYGNRFERDFPGELAVRIFRRPDEREDLLTAMGHIASRSWQGEVGVGFGQDEREIRSISRSLLQSRFRGYVLYVRDQPAAFWYGSACGDRFHVGTTGFDPQFADYRAGTYLLMQVIRDLCSDPSISFLDYGLGDADYKSRYGSRRWEERDVVLFHPRPRAFAVRVLLAVVEVAQNGLDRATANPRLKRELKRAWRSIAHTRRRGQ